MIGICTRYNRGDTTHAGLAIARYLDDTGRASSLMRYDWRAKHVDPCYDNRVKIIKDDKWLLNIKHMCWTAPVVPFFVKMLRKKAIKNTLYTSWEYISEHDKFGLEKYHHVLLPTMLQALQVRDMFKLKNVAVLPFYCGYPITRKKHLLKPDQVHVCMSLYSTQMRKIDMTQLFMLAELLSTNPHVHVTIPHTNAITVLVQRHLKACEKTFEGRWKNVCTSYWHDYANIMANSDLTIWPAKYDGMGIVGLTSLHMGTPVLAWDVPPINEILVNGKNAILVPAEIEYSPMSVPRVKPDVQLFEKTLKWLVNDPQTLLKLTLNTDAALEKTDKEFKNGLKTILPIN